MKSAIAVFVCLLATTAAAFSQDLSSFYVISGFRLPALHDGQYAFSLTPHYTLRPSDYASFTTSSSTASTPTATTTTTGDNYTSYYTPYKAFYANTNFTYGISDKTTASIGVTYQPYSTYGTRSTNSSSYSFVDPSLNNTDSFSGGPTAFKTESLAGSFVLAHRLLPNIELSLAGSWSYARSPYSGTTTGSAFHSSGGATPVFTSTVSSSDVMVSNNTHSFDISASIVILGY
jgi:hypothetical protein